MQNIRINLNCSSFWILYTSRAFVSISILIMVTFWTLVDWSNRSVNFFLNKFTMDDMDDFPKFEITDHFIEKCSFYRGPEFPCLRVRLELFRRISYYILRIYGPSFLLTLTSFVGFWIPAVGYPARVRILWSN